MHEVNARLVEIDASMGWIASSDADASVYEWQTGGTGPVHGAGVSEE